MLGTNQFEPRRSIDRRGKTNQTNRRTDMTRAQLFALASRLEVDANAIYEYCQALEAGVRRLQEVVARKRDRVAKLRKRAAELRVQAAMMKDKPVS
jgi:predicted nuclease with TOPRIM domain